MLGISRGPQLAVSVPWAQRMALPKVRCATLCVCISLKGASDERTFQRIIKVRSVGVRCEDRLVADDGGLLHYRKPNGWWLILRRGSQHRRTRTTCDISM